MALLTQLFLREHGLDALCERFAIRAVRHPKYLHLIQLKYNQNLSPMSEPIVQQCRGLLVDESRNWEVVCHPFDKFFNWGEPLAAAIDWSTARVFEKLDGSLMSLYFYNGAWQVASSGQPDAGGPLGSRSGFSMAQGFWEAWASLGYERPPSEFEGWWFGFEFMTPWSQVIVRHARPRIVLIGARRADGTEVSIDEVPSNWLRAASFPLRSIEEARDAAEQIDPTSGEGFVVCDARFARVKIKSPRYVALHHMRTSFSTRRMVETVRASEGDEFLSYFPDFRPEFEDVSERYESLIARCDGDYERIRGIESPRLFAEAARQARVPAALFALRNGKAKGAREFFAGALVSPLISWLGLRDEGAQGEPEA